MTKTCALKQQLQQWTSVCNVAYSEKRDCYNWPTARGYSGSARHTLKEVDIIYT